MKLDKFHNEEINRVNRKINEYWEVLEKYDYVKFDFKQSGLKTHDEAFKVIASLTKSGKYIAEREKDIIEWRLSKNPNFELNESVRQTNNSIRKTNRIQIGSLIITGVAIVATFFYQKWSYDILKSEYAIHITQEEARKSEEAPERSRQYIIQGTLESIQRNLDSISLKKTYR